MSERDLLSRVVRSVALGVVGALVILAIGCDASHAADAHGDSAGHASAERSSAEHSSLQHAPADHRELAAGEPSDFSVYHAESDWIDQHGTTRALGSLAGRVQVVAMVYTSCAYACPRIMLDMKRIEAELGAEYEGEVGFVVVSIDPERDTPEKLAEFAEGSRLDPARWTLLHGSPGDIRELAVLLGVQYRRTAPGEWVHSNLLTVLDRDGEIVHRQLGLGTDPTGTLDAIRAAADG
ncbi:MAG: SCO family protein [Candidatus Longimicrobiales bacterium M2_2A_002]